MMIKCKRCGYLFVVPDVKAEWESGIDNVPSLPVVSHFYCPRCGADNEVRV